jgi:hypothetical protein
MWNLMTREGKSEIKEEPATQHVFGSNPLLLGHSLEKMAVRIKPKLSPLPTKSEAI